MITKQQQQPFYFLPITLLVIAVGFLISLLFTIQEEVFFSGDAGVKFLMVKQIAKGGSAVTLHLDAPLWVGKIWSQGYYPFKIPFVYESQQGSVVSFPPAFQWLNACLYKWLGFKGIYLIPFFSITLLWCCFIIMMQKAGVKPLIISFVFFLLAFCSPLTVYGALYWEHSLAIVLFFSGIFFLITQRPSFLQAAILGLSTGVAVMFRPEMLLLCLLLMIAVMFNNWREKKKTTAIIFIVSLFSSITAFFIFNSAVYGSILGAHSYQLLESTGFANYFMERLVILIHLNGRLVIYFPLVVLFYGLMVYSLYKNSRSLPLVNQLALIAIFFLLMLPFVLPNAGGKQWGPRYLLPVIPILIAALGLGWENYGLQKVDKRIYMVLMAVGTYSMYVNTYLGYRSLKDDYAYRVKPGYDFLKKETGGVVVVQNQYIAQEFAALIDRKYFFLAEKQQSFDSLRILLNAEGVKKIIYISHDSTFKRLPYNEINHSPDFEKIGDYYFAAYEVE